MDLVIQVNNVIVLCKCFVSQMDMIDVLFIFKFVDGYVASRPVSL